LLNTLFSCIYFLMKNLTISLDEKTAALIRVYAAKRGMSVSRYVGELLNEHMAETRSYNQAMRNFLARKPFKFEFVDGRRPTREELHDRAGLR
jgi:hypothetical protein